MEVKKGRWKKLLLYAGQRKLMENCEKILSLSHFSRCFYQVEYVNATFS